jgi:hypothetical protein
MNEEQKAQLYSQLTYNYDRLANEIASIKGESIDLNPQQQERIQKLQMEQHKIMSRVQQLMN